MPTTSQDEQLELVPFNIFPLDVLYSIIDKPGGTTSSGSSHSSSSHSSSSSCRVGLSVEELAAAERAVADQGEVVRALKASGLSNQSPEVQRQVQVRG